MVRTFRIRTRHEAARLVLAADRIPAEFRYPLDRPDCPLWEPLSAFITARPSGPDPSRSCLIRWSPGLADAFLNTLLPAPPLNHRFAV